MIITIRNSVSTQNAFSGFSAVGAALPRLLIENSESSYNGTNGVNASNICPNCGITLVVRISNMVITGNATGLFAGAVTSIESFGNNKNADNTTNGSPGSTIAQQ